MTISRYISLLVVIMSGIVGLPKPAEADYIWHSFRGHQYSVTQNWSNWSEAEAEAVRQGGHLVTINDADENSWLAQTFHDTYNYCDGNDACREPGQAHVWIGYYYDHPTWKWVSGEQTTFTPPWASNFPLGGVHAYLHVLPHPDAYQWNENPFHDDTRSGYPKGIIEKSEASGFYGVFPRVEFTLGPKDHDDSYWARGWLKLADNSNGISPMTEPVTIQVGSFSHTIPAGSFIQDGSAYRYSGMIGQSKLDVAFWPKSTPGVYWFKSCVKNGNLADTNLQPKVQLTIGDDSGQAALDFGYAKFGKGADGQKWVFPPAQ